MMIDKLGLIHITNSQILMARSKGKDLFYLPGGKREIGESDQTALIREIKEELNVDLVESSIQYEALFQAQADGKPPGVVVQIKAYNAIFNDIPAPTNEIEEIKLLGYNDLDKVAEIDKLIFEYLHSKGLLT